MKMESTSESGCLQEDTARLGFQSVSKEGRAALVGSLSHNSIKLAQELKILIYTIVLPLRKISYYSSEAAGTGWRWAALPSSTRKQ